VYHGCEKHACECHGIKIECFPKQIRLMDRGDDNKLVTLQSCGDVNDGTTNCIINKKSVLMKQSHMLI